MGKGNRNRLDRTDAVKEPKKIAPKVKKPRKALAKSAKIAIACALAVLIVAGVVVGALWSNGVFRSRTPLVESKNGQYNLTKASSAYLLWESQINYMISLYSSWGYLSSTNAMSVYTNLLSSYRSQFMTPTSLRTVLENNADSLTGYVAVCDLAESLGITLTDEEIKAAKENALTSLDTWVNIANNAAMSKLSAGTTIKVDNGNGGTKEVAYNQKYYNQDICSNGSDFLKKYIGADVTKQDVQNAAVIAALYNKVLTDKNKKVEESLIKNGIMDEEQLKAYRDDNKSSFFSTDYIEYVTEDKNLKEAIEAATDAKAVKKLIAEAVANKAYKALYNKYATGTNSVAEALYKKLSDAIKNDKAGTLTKDILTGSEFELTFQEKLKKDAITDVPTKVKTWVTDSSRKSGDVETIAVTDDGIYVAVYIEKGTDSDKNDIFTFAFRKCELVDAADSFKDEENFKQNIINSVLINLELIDETDEIREVYTKDTKAEDGDSDEKKERIAAAVSILVDMKSEVNSALTTKNEKYVKYTEEDLEGDNKEKNLITKWLFGINSDDAGKKKDPAKEADTYVEEKTEGDGDNKKTTYTVYAVIKSMKLDDATAIWGGYLSFTGSDRDTQAAEAVEKLMGKSGVELWRALQELGATVDYGFEESDLSKMSDLSKWLFDEKREAGEIGKITGKETSSSSSSSSGSSTTEVEVTYVAVVIERTQNWKASAMSGSINKTIEDWLKECREGYKLNSTIMDALPTTETTTAADK